MPVKIDMLESVYFLLTQETRGEGVRGAAAGDAPAHQNGKGTFGYKFSDSPISTQNAAYNRYKTSYLICLLQRDTRRAAMYVPISPLFRMAMYFYAVYALSNINIGAKCWDFRHSPCRSPGIHAHARRTALRTCADWRGTSATRRSRRARCRTVPERSPRRPPPQTGSRPCGHPRRSYRPGPS